MTRQFTPSLVSTALGDHAAASRLWNAMKGRRPEGVRHRIARLAGWDAWSGLATDGAGSMLSSDGPPVALGWVERDAFNSQCLDLVAGRGHLRVERECPADRAHARAVGYWLRDLLLATHYDLVSLRVLGQDPLLLNALHLSGARFILTSVWRYRRPAVVPVAPIPDGLRVDVHDIRTRHLPRETFAELMQLAARCDVSDRYFCDPSIDPVAAKHRFLETVRNALSGIIASRAIVLMAETTVVGLVFFESSDEKGPLAGHWLTLMIDPRWRGRRFGDLMMAHAIAHVAERTAMWTCRHAAHNFASAAIAQRLGFEQAAFVQDFHWWRDDTT